MSSYIFIPGMVLMFMLLMVLIFHYSFKNYEAKKTHIKKNSSWGDYSWWKHIRRYPEIFIVQILAALFVSFLWPVILPIAVISMFSYFLYKKLKSFLERHF